MVGQFLIDYWYNTDKIDQKITRCPTKKAAKKDNKAIKKVA